MVFQKGGRLAQNLVFKYGDIKLEIVKKFNYLGIVLPQVVHFLKHRLPSQVKL